MKLIQCVRDHCARIVCRIVPLALPLICAAVASAQTLVVRIDGINGSATPAGLGNGWGSNAYLYLPDGLARAAFLIDDNQADNVQVWVRGQNDSDGFTYFPDDG